MLRKPKLAERAEHAAAWYAAQLSFFDFRSVGQNGIVLRNGYKVALLEVRSAGDYLDRRVFSDVHLADNELVGVRVLFNGQDFSHHDVLDFFAFYFVALHLRATHRHRFREFFRRHFGFGVFIEPFHGKIHFIRNSFLSGLSELVQKTHVVLEEQAHIVDSITAHSDALQAEAERKAAVYLRVNAAV